MCCGEGGDDGVCRGVPHGGQLVSDGSLTRNVPQGQNYVACTPAGGWGFKWRVNDWERGYMDEEPNPRI